uniref:Uncharacterized protein n=1 Tax=Odontella aurita TaxID=265563 RepID=A0A7S4N9E7_9STRA|mmetsp:Transcript_53587/g.160388  ORF Transcript_53587/g.160388 Transcript_53587/m.160388 type:complete len:198 (+) Transcript_53587:405-998(+)
MPATGRKSGLVAKYVTKEPMEDGKTRFKCASPGCTFQRETEQFTSSKWADHVVLHCKFASEERKAEVAAAHQTRAIIENNGMPYRRGVKRSVDEGVWRIEDGRGGLFSVDSHAGRVTTAPRLVERETSVAKREAKVAEREAKMADREAVVGEREANVAEREANLAEREVRVTEKEARMAEKKSRVIENQAEAPEEEG